MSARLDTVNLELVPASRVEASGAELALGRVGRSADRLVVSLPDGPSELRHDLEGETTSAGVLVGPRSSRNAAALRKHLPWLRPRPLGLRTSAGLGDRLGLATPGHVRALRAVGGGIAPIFAQQSIREMTRTGRTPQQVMDDATWGVFAEGWQRRRRRRRRPPEDDRRTSTPASPPASPSSPSTPASTWTTAADHASSPRLRGRLPRRCPGRDLEDTRADLRRPLRRPGVRRSSGCRIALRRGDPAARGRQVRPRRRARRPRCTATWVRPRGRGWSSSKCRWTRPKRPPRTPSTIYIATELRRLGVQLGQPGAALRRPLREGRRLHRRPGRLRARLRRARGHRAAPRALQAEPALRARTSSASTRSRPATPAAWCT